MSEHREHQRSHADSESFTHDVFLSHRARDKGVVRELAEPPPCCEPARSPPPRSRRRPIPRPSLRLPPIADALALRFRSLERVELFIASAAAHCRRTRSSITGANAEYFFPIRLIVAASCMPRASQFLPNQPRRICSVYFFLRFLIGQRHFATDLLT